MKDKSAYLKILKARASLVIEHPFFASLALRLRVKEDFSCGTAWTDGRVFAYNPDYVKILSSEKLLGLAAHIVMHPACAHHKRRKNRDPDAWNRACDYAVNPMLLDAGFILPDGFLYDEKYQGKSADAVYELLQGEFEESQGRQEADQDLEKDENNLSDSPGADDGSSEDSGENDDMSDFNEDPGKSGAVRDQPLEGGIEGGEEPEIDWDEALVLAAANARGMGKLPRGMDLFVENRINPKLPWQELLSRFIENSAKSDYSWTTPNRRYIHQGLYFPSLRNQQLSEIAVAIDTSGSIQPEELTQFEAELSAILENNPAKVHLLYCDMKVNQYQTFDRWDLPFTFNPKGGGGTDFIPAFEFLEKNQIFPACLIFLTDLECRSFPDHSPFFPVLWVKTGQNPYVPPFGDLLCLDMDQ